MIRCAAIRSDRCITQGTVNVSFTHDTDHQRLQKLDTKGGLLTTTLYLAAGPVSAEKVTSNGGANVTWNEYLMAGGEMIGVRFNSVSGNTLSTRYFHKDHLGSVATLTDENGSVAQRISYDAWGRQRDAATWADDPTGNLPAQDQTTRGFAGLEQLADVGLVHMNGRVYDPLLGRFTSADPIVQDPYNAQSLNRYSYVYDNPLSYTDPNGHCFLGICHLFNAIGHAFDSVARGIGSFLRSNQIIATIIQVVVVAAAVVACNFCAVGVAFAISAQMAGLESGKLGVALKAGVIAAATTAAFIEVGTITGNIANATPGTLGQVEAAAFNVVGHAAVGCVSAAASGQSCGPSALAGAITSAAGPLINGQGFSVESLVANTVLGGVAAVVGGGKFENGAITGAFGYLFNSASHSTDDILIDVLTKFGELLEANSGALGNALNAAAAAADLSAIPIGGGGSPLVCRGGTCTADRFTAGSGVIIDANGKLQGVSVNSAPGATLQELTSTILNKQVGVTTVREIEAAGGIITPSPTPNNPFHCTLCGITAEKAQQLFTPTVPNPNR